MSEFVLSGVTFNGKFELPAGLSRVGRNPTNDFRISDASVSSFHCEIEVSADGVTVRDLGSTNGTFINEAQITEAALNKDQFLKLGGVEFRLEVAGSEPPAYIPATQPRHYLENHIIACLNHRDSPAQYECSRCKGAHCESCVRILRRASGGELVFCPNCSGECERIPGAPPRKVTGPTFLGRLTQTMRLKR